MPPHKLKLKVGTLITLLSNLNAKRGLTNGTRLVVLRGLPDNFTDGEVITGSQEGRQVLIVQRWL